MNYLMPCLWAIAGLIGFAGCLTEGAPIFLVIGCLFQICAYLSLIESKLK